MNDIQSKREKCYRMKERKGWERERVRAGIDDNRRVQLRDEERVKRVKRKTRE